MEQKQDRMTSRYEIDLERIFSALKFCLHVQHFFIGIGINKSIIRFDIWNDFFIDTKGSRHK